MIAYVVIYAYYDDSDIDSVWLNEQQANEQCSIQAMQGYTYHVRKFQLDQPDGEMA